MFTDTAYGHGLYEPLPANLFEVKFDWDPTLVFFGLVLIFYSFGLASFKNRMPIAPWQVLCFFIGMAINIAALSPPIDPLSDRLFSFHMIQHVSIVMIGVPFMLLGSPYFVIIRGLNPWVRRNLYLPLLKSPILRTGNRFFVHPLIALALFEVNFWFWHIPKYYNLALLNDYIHLLEHALMAWTAIFLWRNIIDAKPMPAKLHMGVRLLLLGAIMALNIALAAALTYASEVWYAYEGIPMPEWWASRWDRIQDQRLGGLIMWVPGGFCMFLAMTATFFVWAHRENVKEKQRLEAKKLIDSMT